MVRMNNGRLFLVFLLCLVGVLSLINVGFSATLYVNGTGAGSVLCNGWTGTNYSTIQTAINAASDGDTIYVCAKAGGAAYGGQNVVINKSINLFGNQSDAGGVWVRISPPAAIDQPVFKINISYVNISNFTLSGATNSNGIAILNPNSVITNITITNTIISHNQNGIFVNGSHGNTFNNLTIINNSKGIWLFSASNTTIIFTTITNSSSNGINSEYTNEGGNFSSNTISNSSNGVLFNNANNTLITFNVIYNNTLSGISIATSSNFNNLSYNNVSENANNGITLTSSNNNNLLGNRIYNNSWAGIFTTGIVGGNFSSNIVYRNTQNGINPASSNFTLINFNVIYNNTWSGINLQQSANFNNLSYNNVSENANNGILLDSSNNNTLLGNRVYNNSWSGIGTLGLTSGGNFSSNIVYRNTVGGIDLSRSNFTLINFNVIYNNTGPGIIIQSSAGFNNLSYNNVSESAGNAGNGITITSSNNTLIGNIIYNNSQAGISVTGIISGNFSSNIVYRNTQSGINLSGSNFTVLQFNTIYNNTWSGISLQSSSNFNNLSYNNVSENIQYGFYSTSSSNNTFLGNRAYNNSLSGIYIESTNSGGNLSSNIVYNNTIIGIFFNYANNTVLESNIVYNNTNTAQIYFSYSFYNNLTNNNISSDNTATSMYGAYMDGTSGSNTIRGGTIFGFNATSSGAIVLYGNSHIVSGVVIQTTRLGIGIGGNSTVENNTLNSCGLDSNIVYGCIVFRPDLSPTASVNNNNITNATYYAISLQQFSSGGGSITSFSNNWINNATYGIAINNSASLTFSGINYIYNTPSTGYEIYLMNGTINSNGYNITTDQLTFQLGSSSNVSIKVVNLSAITGLTAVDSISGLSTTSRKLVQTVHGNYYGLNVTNTTNSANLTANFYYNTSDISGYSTSYLGIGSTSSGSTWSYYSSSASGSLVSSSSGATSFSYFGILAYVPTPVTIPSSSSDSTTEVTPSSSFDCTTKTLTVTVSTKVNGGTIKLVDKTIPFQSTVTSKVSNGKATFTISESGTYKIIEGSLPSGYSLTAKEIVIDLTACESGEEPIVECITNSDCSSTKECISNDCVAVTGTCGYASNHAWVSYECCSNTDCTEEGFECLAHECKEEQVVSDEEKQLQEAAQEAINDAQTAIDTAKGEGKDVTKAESRLQQAIDAYNEGNYTQAKLLAEESVTLIKEPKTEESTDETGETSEEEKKGSDYSILLYLVVALVILYVLYKMLAGKKGYKEYKK